jgi:Reverse transcriptase (RNA-dependent DNA polymerase)
MSEGKDRNTVPIANKWVFLTKYNKQGELIKYKARMVAKGCAQRPGYDYMDTFSLVVRLETIQAILPLVVKDKLKIQQMDVKGAYLNGILQENVFMQQPEGYEDESGRVCQLIKTLYGLKQSGHKWNKKLDNESKEKRFMSLKSDPCVYVR